MFECVNLSMCARNSFFRLNSLFLSLSFYFRLALTIERNVAFVIVMFWFDHIVRRCCCCCCWNNKCFRNKQKKLSYGSHAYVCRIMYLAMLRFFSYEKNIFSNWKWLFSIWCSSMCDERAKEKTPYTRKIVQVDGLEPTEWPTNNSNTNTYVHRTI